MRLRFALVAVSLALAACATNRASDETLQEAASLMVSIGQHGEGADIAEASAKLDAQAAAAPNDPYVLKLVAMARRTLSDYSQDRAQRTVLRYAALNEFDKAISLSAPSDPPRSVMINGQPTDVDFSDLAQLRADLFQQVQTDR